MSIRTLLVFLIALIGATAASADAICAKKAQVIVGLAQLIQQGASAAVATTAAQREARALGLPSSFVSRDIPEWAKNTFKSQQDGYPTKFVTLGSDDDCKAAVPQATAPGAPAPSIPKAARAVQPTANPGGPALTAEERQKMMDRNLAMCALVGNTLDQVTKMRDSGVPRSYALEWNIASSFPTLPEAYKAKFPGYVNEIYDRKMSSYNAAGDCYSLDNVRKQRQLVGLP